MDDLTKFLEKLESQSIWRPNSVADEPETNLTQWRVYRVAADLSESGDTTHFVGYAEYEGRVCSAVQTYDPVTKRGVTQSGRVYELVGPSGYNKDAMYVWGRWLARLADPNILDITDEYEYNTP